MLPRSAAALGAAFALTPVLHAQGGGPQFAAGGQLGYTTGLGIQAHLAAASFARGFPLQTRLGLSYPATQPGHALNARRIFINNATNGTPEQSGW